MLSEDYNLSRKKAHFERCRKQAPNGRTSELLSEDQLYFVRFQT